MKVFLKTNLILPLFLFICALGALLLWPCNVRAEEKEVGAFKLTTDGAQDTDYKYENNVLTILTNTPITIANREPGATTDAIVVAESVTDGKITLAGVNIDVGAGRHSAFSLKGKASVSLTLAESSVNKLVSETGSAGLQVPKGTALTIGGSGSLEAKGGSFGAGIGGELELQSVNGDAGDVTITGGSVTGIGGDGGAGIGGGKSGAGGIITITGGSVTAIGDQGAGIGAIAINGGSVTAEGGSGGAERRMRMYREQCAAEEKTLEEMTQSVPSYKERLKHGDTWQFKKHLHGNLVFTRGDREKEENI